jgi:hypothetical protein
MQWQVSRSQDFSTLVLDVPVNTLEIAGRPLDAGSYFWRVNVPVTAAIVVGTRFSTPPRRFTVKASARIKLEYPIGNTLVDGASTLRTPVNLRWSSAEPLLSSRLVLSSNPNPLAPEATLILDLKNGGQSVQLPRLAEGTYYWTVQAQAAGDVNITPLAPAVFRIGPVPLLPAVTLQTPANNSAITAEALRQTRTISFTWTALPSSATATGGTSRTAYILSIYRATDTRRAAPIFRSQPLSRTSYALENLAILDADSFVWSIEPVTVSDAIEQRGTIREATFRIDIKIPEAEKLNDEQSYGN